MVAYGRHFPRRRLARSLRKSGKLNQRARVAKLADARDLKSLGPKGLCGFDSRPGHHQRWAVLQRVLHDDLPDRGVTVVECLLVHKESRMLSRWGLGSRFCRMTGGGAL